MQPLGRHSATPTATAPAKTFLLTCDSCTRVLLPNPADEPPPAVGLRSWPPARFHSNFTTEAASGTTGDDPYSQLD